MLLVPSPQIASLSCNQIEFGLGGRNLQLLAYLYLVRTREIVCLDNFVGFVWVAIERLADIPKIVSRFDDVHRSGSDRNGVLQIRVIGIDFFDLVPGAILQKFGWGGRRKHGLSALDVEMF